jgi:hypothetical protein
MELAVLRVDFGDADIERNGYFVEYVFGHNPLAPLFKAGILTSGLLLPSWRIAAIASLRSIYLSAGILARLC